MDYALLEVYWWNNRVHVVLLELELIVFPAVMVQILTFLTIFALYNRCPCISGPLGTYLVLVFEINCLCPIILSFIATEF